MMYVDNCMQNEGTRLTECLDISTKGSLVQILEDELIGNYLSQILHVAPEVSADMLFEEEHVKQNALNKTEFDSFMLEKRVEDLQRLASQMTRVKGAMAQLKDRWKRHVYDQGFAMLNDEQLAKKTFRAIEDFIEYRHKADDLVERVFQGKEM